MLKCSMIHAFPDLYKQLYAGFNPPDSGAPWINPGTLNAWIADMLRLSRQVVSQDPEFNRTKLLDEIGPTWQVNFNGTTDDWTARAQNMSQVTRQAKEAIAGIGAKWELTDPTQRETKANPKVWKFTLAQVIRYIGRDEINKFKGDMLEVLAEIFFKVFQADESVGLTDYEPVPVSNDYGTDAIAINPNGHRSVVQVKFRSNSEDHIGYPDIARTFTSGILHHHVSDLIEHEHTVFLFTTATGVTGPFDIVMKRKSVIIDRPVIAYKIDNNKTFWRLAYNEIMETTAIINQTSK